MTHKIAVIGSGRRGAALLEIFNKDEKIEILGVAEINENLSTFVKEKEGFLDVAQKYNLEISPNFLDLIIKKDLDVIADLTRSKNCHEKILKNVQKPNVEIVEGKSAWLFSQLVTNVANKNSDFEKVKDEDLKLSFRRKRKKYRKPIL